jgi:hypothetical protein
MNQFIGNYEKANSPVFETNSMLFASAVCDSLEKAGIPARLYRNGHYSVDVPAELLAESCELLFTEPISGEIYSERR